MPRHYTETEKLGTMLMALELGVAETVKQTDTPRPTIYSWFRESGGIPAVHAFLDETVFSAKAQAISAVYDAIRRSADGDGLTAEMVEAVSKLATERTESLQAVAAAQAKSELHLHIGEDEIIVPREDD